MASFEPVVLLFASPQDLSTIDFRLPVTFVFAIDEDSLEARVSINPPLYEPCLQRYFVVLLQAVRVEVWGRLQNNHRVQVIYTQEPLAYTSQSAKQHRIINKQLQQFTLDLTADITRFLTTEGEKQEKLERFNLTKIYYRQVRLLKEWAMSFAKAQGTHILVIPLNTNKTNLDNAVGQIRKFCDGFRRSDQSLIVRILDDYVSSTDKTKTSLFPYNEILFHHEHPQYICQLITKLCPIRLYLYGNDETISSQWSEMMISQETTVMEDEDSWCAFIENESISDEIKWNIGPMFAAKWQVKRVTPIALTGLDRNLRFQSALRRALKTFSPRQIEVTSEIFAWHDNCVRQGFLRLEPQLSSAVEEKRIRFPKDSDYPSWTDERLYSSNNRSSNFKNLSFVWLDKMLYTSNDYWNKLIQPHSWNFFNDFFQCEFYLQTQLHRGNQIFLIASGGLGYQLLNYGSSTAVPRLSYVYIYCAQLGRNEDYMKHFPQIRGVFNDSLKLGEQIQTDLTAIYQIHQEKSLLRLAKSKAIPQIDSHTVDDLTCTSIPIIVYNEEEVDLFIGYQRTIDTLLGLPCDEQSRTEMLEEFRRIHTNDLFILDQIDIFDHDYNANNAVHWYTRDSFLFRTINEILRSNDVNIIFKFRHFLIDLYKQLDDIYRETINSCHYSKQDKFYRGHMMSREGLDSFRQSIGRIISINTFFSTTTSFQIALVFADSFLQTDNCLSVIFCIEHDAPLANQRPYANISQLSNYLDEEEVLFAMGNIFRIQAIEELDRKNPIPIIYLKMIDWVEVSRNHFPET